MVKEFHFRGKNLEELKKMSIDEVAKLFPSRARRSLRRGFTEQHKKLLEGIRKNPDKFHKTHVRDMIILPEMSGAKLGIYKGGAKAGDSSKWVNVVITPQMIGHRIGEYSIPIGRVKHSAPGIGASKGSKHIATKT
ncbi:MAG: 30S ribosomal protein S19 [Candidatus Aenigmarchaeota archaeon]|nr:30S ribosomal protein S19 [Candidatus Aenigmarchaeota archaeon]